MGQHLYTCQRDGCGKIGVAHYLLIAGILWRYCTACWQEWKSNGGREG